jgi:hypothetical protein
MKVLPMHDRRCHARRAHVGADQVDLAKIRSELAAVVSEDGWDETRDDGAWPRAVLRVNARMLVSGSRQEHQRARPQGGPLQPSIGSYRSEELLQHIVKAVFFS